VAMATGRQWQRLQGQRGGAAPEGRWGLGAARDGAGRWHSSRHTGQGASAVRRAQRERERERERAADGTVVPRIGGLPALHFQTGSAPEAVYRRRGRARVSTREESRFHWSVHLPMDSGLKGE